MEAFKNLLLYCLLIIVFFSCKSFTVATGIYKSYNKPNGYDMSVDHKFIIKTDSTFDYHYTVMGYIEKYSSGTWESIDKNIIKLHSDIQSNIVPLNIEVTSSNSENPLINLNLVVHGKDENHYRCTPYSALTENYYVEKFLPDRGSYSYEESNYYSNIHELFFKVSKEPYDFIPGRGKIKYYLLDTEQKKITLNDGDIVNITVTVPDSLFSYRIFNDTKLKFSGNKLIFEDSEENNKKNKLFFENSITPIIRSPTF